MQHYRYTLEPYGDGKNTRFACPACQKRRQFTRYVDTETGQHLHWRVGSCNRSHKCGYHYTPRQYFADYPDAKPFSNQNQTEIKRGATAAPNRNQTCFSAKAKQNMAAKREISLIPEEVFEKSRRQYERNNFVSFLVDKFGRETAERLVSRYHIGTSRKWPGATVFWQIDRQGKIRTGKIMLYDRHTGKRVKEPYSHICWAHTMLRQERYSLSQCLFGEHLLGQFPDKPVAVVESEKTAIICSSYLPEYVWLATGSKNNFSRERCVVLKGRIVTLFPDVNGYKEWNEKAESMKGLTTFTVSNIIESIATQDQRTKGLDLVDFILKSKS